MPIDKETLYGLSPRQIEQLLRLSVEDLITRTVTALDGTGHERIAQVWDQNKSTLTHVINSVREELFNGRKEDRFRTITHTLSGSNDDRS